MKMVSSLRNKFASVWRDPVWSKVIGSLFVTALVALILKITTLVKQIDFGQAAEICLNSMLHFTPIPNFLLLLTIGTAIFILIKLRSMRRTILLGQPTIDSSQKTEQKSNGFQYPGIVTTAFFQGRICDAFPSTRGLDIISNRKLIYDRLDIFLREPIKFDPESSGNRTDPIWLFRGSTSIHIDSYKRISKTKALLKYDEVRIDKLAVYHAQAYYKCFIYCELEPEKPISIAKYSAEDIADSIEEFGYASQEYAVLNNKQYSRREYDDGSAVRNGRVLDISGAEIRVRYLSRYNFILAAPDSPMNSQKFERQSEMLLNEMLKGNKSTQDLLDVVESLSKNEF